MGKPLDDFTKDKVWCMHHEQGMSKSAICRALGLSYNAVSNVLNPGRKRHRALNERKRYKANKRYDLSSGRLTNTCNKVRVTLHDTPLLSLLTAIVKQAHSDATEDERARQWLYKVQSDVEAARWDNQRQRNYRRSRWS